MSAKQALAVGVILGVTCALVVWYLERFEMNRLHGDISDYLAKRDRFNEWLKSNPEPSS